MDAALDKRAFVFSAVGAIATLQYYCLTAIVILYYDFLLTFKQEVDRIWRHKISFVSCIFILNRYLTCLGYIPVVYFIFNSPKDDKACTGFARFPGALSTITQFFVVVFLVMRVYALYQRKTWVLWATIPFGIATIIVSALGLMQLENVNLSFGPQTIFKTCVPSNLKTNLIFKISWFINGAFDTVIFAFTIYKTASMVRLHREAGVRSSLAELLMRDGGMFFGILAVSNLVHVILFLVSKNTYFEESAGNNPVLTHTLTSTLLSRLILNLRGVGARKDHWHDETRLSTRLSVAPPEDIMLVSASTFGNSSASRGTDDTLSPTVGSSFARTNIMVQTTLAGRNRDAHVS